MAGETIGWGTEFHLHNGTALTELVGVFNVGIPEGSTEEVEVTHYKSANKFREFIAGLRERGEFTVEMNYVPGSATDTLCQSAFGAADRRAFKIVLPDDEGQPAWEIDGEAFAKSYPRNIPLEDRITAQLNFRVSGDIAEAAAA